MIAFGGQFIIRGKAVDMPELQRFSAHTADFSEVWEAFDRDGGLIIEDFIAPELLARLTAEVTPMVQQHRSGSTTPGF